MIGNLSQSQIDRLLQKEVIGRIGCHSAEMIYVVPISYAYEGETIYAHTFEGLKVDMMRKNPEVCFEVDDLKDMGNWKSVIAWGRFEEITEVEERKKATKILINRHLPVVSSSTTHLGSSWPFYSDTADPVDGIVFKIVLNRKTGKFETPPPLIYD